MIAVQEYMRMAIKDGEEATAAGLLYVQTCANHAALEAKIKEKDAKFDEAMADFDRGILCCFAANFAMK